MQDFWQDLNARVKKYDLLCHPFYQAWTEGKLTREDLREYATDYYQHVAAFPLYLRALAVRLPDAQMRGAVLMNMADELGEGSPDGRSHDELWLDFAEAMGADRDRVKAHAALPEIATLKETFEGIAVEASPAAALAAFYAYESQVPRIATAKNQGLREMYGADAKACRYFTLHQTADIHHSNVWKREIERELAADPAQREAALETAEAAARALWTALDGIERERMARVH